MFRAAVLLALVAGCSATGQPRLSPASAGQGGGTPVRIEGDDFAGHGALVVYFGPRAAKAVVIESRWLVTAVAPQGDALGAVDVLLRFGDGTELTLPQAFTYEAQPGLVLQPPIGG